MVPEKAIEAQGQTFPGGIPDAKRARVLARSFYAELRSGGFDHNQILAASTELLDMVTEDLRAARLPKAGVGGL